MPDLPKVSVILSSYNRPKLIRDAVESVLEQEGVAIELLIADDWSDPALLESLSDVAGPWRGGMADNRIWSYDRCTVVRPPGPPPTQGTRHRSGGGRCAVAINVAMRHATGEFVAFLPDDDFLVPGSLASRARFLVEHPEAIAVYGQLEACHPFHGTAQPGRHMLAYWTNGPMLQCGDRDCLHNRDGFWSAEPITRAANKVDHGQMMVRRLSVLPQGTLILAYWPEYPTAEYISRDQRCGFVLNGQCVGEGHSPLTPQESLMATAVRERFDCPDAGWFFRLEYAGLGPFYSVPDVVVVKRYHTHGHRTDPAVRE